MKIFLLLGILFLSTSIICAQETKEQSPSKPLKVGTAVPPKYTIAVGVNVLDNGESNLPWNSVYSFKTPFFFTAERRFNSKLSLALTLSTNRLSIASVEKGYFSIDAVGQFYFNEYLFNSKKIEMYAGLGLGRFFLENKGNNTFNVSGGGRYWFSEHFGINMQGIGKVGLSPINKSVLNHYQYNLGLVWRSNRNKDKEVDAVTKFEEIKNIASIQEQELSGKIKDKETKSLLDDPKLTIVEKKQDLITEKAGDTTKEQNCTMAKENGKTDLPLVIQNKGYDYKIGGDLGKYVGIKMIYFALDKYFITNQAALDLEKILFVLNEYPTMKIDIRSHTDCRQTIKYNQVLSENRAKATMNWLVKKGIDKSRLTAKGYGQSQLINNCYCSLTKKSSCTEEEHQANRRSEFIITSF